MELIRKNKFNEENISKYCLFAGFRKKIKTGL